MYNSILIGVKQKKFNKYSEAFNFFQSKSINNIIATRKLEYVIHFRDLQIFDDQTQYIKRYYTTHETVSRTRKLISYYEVNMTPPSPNIIPVQNYNLIETNHRKHIKLLVMQEKSQARRNEQEEEQQEDQDSGQMILPKIDDSNFSEINSEKEEDNQSDSYDSQPFNAYEIEEDELIETGRKVKDQEVISIKQIPDSFLVLDFRDAVEEHPKINVLPPVVLPPAPPKTETVTTGMQTMPLEMLQPARIIQKQPLPKTVIIPQLKKQPALKSESHLQQRNELKKENMILTDSIQMVYRKQQRQKQKSKPSTFMQYYNSQPVKAPSNILQRYIKRKK